jgi:glutathione peroxidase-family protein
VEGFPWVTDLLSGHCTQGTPTFKNFTKFLVSRSGEIVGRFEPAVKPESKAMTDAVEAELKKK